MNRSQAELIRLANDLDAQGNFAFAPHTIVVPGGTTISVTWCNCFISVFCAALGCPVAPMKASDQILWLMGDGKLAGWQTVDRETARQRAASGFPTIAAWMNPANGSHSHIAIVVPSPDSDPANVYVSAAGAENFNRARLERSFGIVAPMLYFTHD